MDITGVPLHREPGLLLVLDTPKGRGVFAGKDIPANTVIEVSPVLVLDPVENEKHIRKTDLYNYTYNWPYQAPSKANHVDNGDNKESYPAVTQAVILGLGSMFNHSRLHQNVGWKRDVEKKLVTYRTLRDVKKGEELCISYGDRLTFVDVEAKMNESDDDETSILANITLD